MGVLKIDYLMFIKLLTPCPECTRTIKVTSQRFDCAASYRETL